MYVADKMIP